MARDSLSKYIKKSSARSRNVAQKSGSWISNAIKSVGYSTFDVLEELLPSTIDVAKVTASTGKDIAESIKKARTSDRSLKTAIDRNYYMGLGREVFKNSLEDLKSGKFYNKERADKFFGDMNDDMMDVGDFDFGDEDFDAGESDDFSGSVDSSDGMAHATFRRKKGGNDEVTSIVVGTDLGPESAMYQATSYQTETMVNVGRAVVDHSNSNARATLTMLGNMRNEFTAALTSINDNVSTLSTSITDTLSKHSALSAKYYEDSISLQTQILEAIRTGEGRGSTQVNTRTFKEYNNVMDMFSAGGGIDPKAYAQLVSKQLNNYIDSNMVLSQLKFMAGEKETLKMMAQNPLAFIPKAITKQIIPNTVKSIVTEFDNQMRETGIAALNQISGLQRSQNPILSALGKIFGVQNKITISSIDKSAYNKGPAQWTGTDHQALVQVIPTLLRKIHASVSGSEELAFDYEKGTWTKLRDMEKNFERDKISRETSVYADYKSDFREFMDKNLAVSKDQQDAYYKDFETFLQRLARDSAGGRTFRKGGPSGNEAGRDDIRELAGKSTSDDPSVKIIRAFLEGMEGTDNARLTALFGSKTQEQRAQIDRMMREMQENPTKYNTMYMDTGLGSYNKKGKGHRHGIYTDAHLNYTEDATKVKGVTGGIMAGVIDKYGHNQTYYLREILQTLNTGIYVVPVGSLGGSDVNTDPSDAVTRINDRIRNVTDQFGSDRTQARRTTESGTRHSTYDDDKRQRDIQAGKLDTENDFTQEQITALSAGYHRSQHDETNATPSMISKLLGMLPEDSGAARLLNRAQKGIDGTKDGITSVFKKLDTALFQIVFGDPNGQKGVRALFDKTIGVLKSGFFKFSYFIDDKILKPLNEAMFGEDGVFNKFKQTEFWKKVSGTFKDLTSKAGQFFLGDKGPDGTRSGGLFSETANSLKDIGTHVKTAILGEKGPDGKPLPIDQDNSVVGNMKRMFKGVTDSVSRAMGLDQSRPKESLGTKIATGVDAMFSRFNERAKEFSDNVFGEYNGGPEFFKQFKDDMKGQKGFIGASAVVGSVGTMILGSHMGLLGSMFLPGGPIGGALLGGAIGIISKSNGLKDYLFGPEVTDENGNTFRNGGLITKQVQDFFKDNKTGIAVGGIGALASSMGLLPSFFVPGGPIGGALIGGAVSLATKTDEFQRLLYGEGGTKDDPTGGFVGKLKTIFGKSKSMKNVALDAGIGAGVGVIGSFFLPGGPIIGALLGSAASVGMATDKFKTWFFGEEDENGKRKGGLFGRFSDFMKEKIFNPLSTAVKVTQNNIMRFVEKNMVLPFKFAIEPLTKEAKEIGQSIKNKVKGVFDSVKEVFNRRVVQPIGETIDKYFLSPLKNTLKKLFSGFGTLVGNIISAPFKILGGAGWAAYDKQRKRGQEDYKSQVNTQWKEDGGFLGHFKQNRANGQGVFKSFFGAARGPVYDKDKLNEAQYSDKGADYERNQKIERRKRYAQAEAEIDARYNAKNEAVRNGTSVSTNTTVPEGTVAGINLDLFVKRAGLKKSAILGMIRRGEITATRNGDKNWVIPSTEVTRIRNNNQGSSKLPRHTVNRINGTSGVDENQTNVNIESSEEETETTNASLKPSKKKRRGNRKRASERAKNNTRKNKGNTSVSTEIRTNENNDEATSPVSPVSGSDKTHVVSSDKGNTSVNVNPVRNSTSDRKHEGKGTSNFYNRIQKDVSQIANSVYGQLNGVGSNVNKIYKVLLKKNGMKDEDIKGENNKEYVGFFGKIRTALNRPFQAITDLITSPFRKIAEVGHRFVDHVKGIGSSIKKAGKALVTGVGSLVKGLGKGIAGILKEVVKLPFDIIHTGLSAVRAALPVVGEVAKAGASVLADGIRVAGSVVVTGVKSIGGAISGAAKGFGQMVGGAMSGLGSILSSVGLIGADVLKGIWKGAKWLGKTALNVGGAIASAPFKLAGKLFGGKDGDGLFGKKVQHVIVDGGTLDKVKLVNKVKKVESGLGGKGGETPIKPIHPLPIKPLAGGKGGKDEPVTTHVIVDDISEKLMGMFGIGAGAKVASSITSDSGIDTNAGDTSVSTGQTAGGPADDDENKTDNVGETSVATNIANLRASFSEFKGALSNANSAIRDKYNEKIAKRQAQIDKGSRTSMLSRFAAAEKDKEESVFRTKLLSLMGKTAESSTEHKSLFSGIFGKKGLITAGILLLLPIFVKLFKNLKLGDLFMRFMNTVETGFSEIGGISGLVNNVGEKVDQLTAVFNKKEINPVVGKDGNLVYDENGNLVTEETDRTRLGALLTPTRTRINTETGEWEQRRDWTQMSGATVNMLGHKVAIPAIKGVGTAVSTAKRVAGTKLGQSAISGVKALGSKLSNSTAVVGAYTYADDAIKGAKKFGSMVVEKVGSTDVVQTFIKKATEAVNFLISKLAAVGDKFGIKLGSGKFGKFLQFLTSKILNTKALSGYAKKIGEFLASLTEKGTVAAGTAFLAEIAFITYGAIDGAVNAGALFEVNPDAVDIKMRAIAAVFKGLLNTTAGSVIDFINALVSDILGMNFVKDIASWTYDLLSNAEDEEALKAAQADFTKGYEDYVAEEYEAYKKSTEEQGQQAMSFDEFKASSLSTTRSEYNSKTNKSLFRRAVDGVKGIGSGFKKVGATVVNTVKGAGEWIGDKASGLWNGAKNFGSSVVEGAKNLGSNVVTGVKNIGSSIANSKFGQGVSSVVDKGKEMFGKVGSSVANLAKDGVAAGKGLMTGWQNISQAFYNKDNSFLDYFKSEVNPLDENNMFHGIVGGVLNISKFTMFPKLLVAGILKKVGTAIVDVVKKVFTGAKTAIGDYTTNVANLRQLAFAGDMEGLSSYDVTMSEDNPVGGFISGMVGISRILHYPVALVAKAARKVADGVKVAINGAKTAISDYATNVSALHQLAFAGDMEGLSNYEVTTSENNPVSGFVSGVVGLSRLFHYPVALVVAGGKKVVGGIKSAITTVKTTGSAIIDGSLELGGYAIKGDVEALHDYQGISDESNPMSGFANAVFGIEKFVLSPVAYVARTGRKVADFIKGAIGKTVDYGTKAGEFVTKLNTYTDPDKSMSGWDGETMATGEDDAVGSILSTLIKKVMWIYVGIVRTVKKAFDWVSDIGEGIADAASNAWDGISNTASNAWDWVTNKVDAAGTAVMNLGRGGKDGGRPLYGGKGGAEEELNGMPYFSQNDPRYKNVQYKQTGGFGGDDTIGDSGCGPTAMAMVASKFTGKDYNPVTMAKMAEAGGYSTSVGTTPGYFSAAGNALGIPNTQLYPSADSLQTSLASGNPVILQGASGGFGSGNSPYTTEGHYVTATGIDGNNNVIINDPRGKEYSGAYRMSDVINDTTGMWSFGDGMGGYGEGGNINPSARRIKSKLKKGGKGTSSDYARWVSICKAVKQAYAAQQLGYSQSRYTTITVGGKSIKGRTDCSGYVQTCLKFFGVMSEGANLTSANVQNAGDSTMKATGFTPYSWPGWENLKEGDILGTSGHTEIFAYNKDGQHYVYNCGSNSSCNNPNATVTGHKNGYQTIWRCGGAGEGAISSFAVDGSTAGGSYDVSDGATSVSSSSSGGFSSFSELLGGLADAAMSPIYKAFGLNTDNGSSSSVGGDSYSSSSTGTGSAVSNLQGNSDTEKIWNHLTTSTGLDKYAAAGMMGCWQEESSNNPHTVEGYYLKGYKDMGGENTVLANNANLNKFTQSVLFPAYAKSGVNINQSAYKGSDGNYYPGFGLAQWTGPRGWKLFDWSKKQGADWRELGTQLGYVDYELKNNQRGTPSTYNGASSVEDALWKVMKGYEGNSSQSYYNKRLPHAKKYYQLYAGGNGGLGGGRPIRKASPIASTTQSLQKKQRNIQGGFGSVSQVPMSMQDSLPAERRTIIEQNNIIGTADSNNLLQLCKMAVQYLSQIVTNTGDTNSELEALNQKDFGGNISQTNTTNNITDNSMKSYGKAENKDVSDRSEYTMAKRVAQGLLE